MSQIGETEVFKTSEVSKILNLGPDALGRKVRKGEIVASKVGRGYLFSGEDVISFIKSARVPPTIDC